MESAFGGTNQAFKWMGFLNVDFEGYATKIGFSHELKAKRIEFYLHFSIKFISSIKLTAYDVDN
jgi:hypothetical protein